MYPNMGKQLVYTPIAKGLANKGYHHQLELHLYLVAIYFEGNNKVLVKNGMKKNSAMCEYEIKQFYHHPYTINSSFTLEINSSHLFVQPL